MGNRSCFLFCIGCVALLANLCVGDDALQRKFNREYPSAVKRIREVYGKLTIISSTEYDRSDLEDPGLYHSRATCQYFARDGFIRLDRNWIDGDSAGESSVVFGPEGFFVVDKKRGASDYHLRTQKRTVRSPEGAIDWASGVCPLCTAPFTFAGSHIDKILRDPDFVIEEVSASAENSGIVKVQWHWGESVPRSIGSWEFDSQRSWALVASEYKGESNTGWLPRAVGHIEYGESIDGVPLIQKLHGWSEDKSTGERQGVVTSAVEKIELCNVDTSEFTLEAFGVHIAQGPPESNLALWLIGFGVGGLSLAVALRTFTRLLAQRNAKAH